MNSTDERFSYRQSVLLEMLFDIAMAHEEDWWSANDIYSRMHPGEK